MNFSYLKEPVSVETEGCPYPSLVSLTADPQEDSPRLFDSSGQRVVHLAPVVVGEGAGGVVVVV